MGDISDIVVKEVFAFEELENQLRQSRLAQSERLPYTTASIELRDYLPSQLNLTTGYVLRDRLLFQEQLRDFLAAKHGIDLFNLDGIVLLGTPDGDVPLAPPIVEHMHIPFASPQQLDRGCTQLSLDVLLDGAHRCYLAKRLGLTIQCVRISDVDELYQVPIVPNGWNELMVLDQLPERRFKKRYLGDSIEMYRDFSSLGSAGYRK